MKYCFLLAAVLLASITPSFAQLPPPEKLLPNDTLVLVTAPDATKLRAVFTNSPQGQLWNDPAIKAFKEKSVAKFKSDLAAPLEKEFGIKFSDYEGLAAGQFTFALTQNGWKGATNESLGWIFLIDTKDKAAVLKTNLAQMQKKWVESGKQMKAEKIRDLDFTTLITTTDSITNILDKVLPRGAASDESKAPGRKLEIIVGQSGGLLLVGNSAKVIEQVLVHQANGLAPSLSEEASYEPVHNAMFRDAPFYIWMNVKPLIEIFTRRAAETPSDNPLMPKPDKLVSSLGLGGLKTAALSYRSGPEGATIQLSLGIPEATRSGLFKMLVAETKEANPPAFVPADVTKFMRWRLNLPKAWTGLEQMLTDISPAIGGAFNLIFESAGKDKDPNFDLKKELLASLGDDFISYERKSVAEVNSPPSIYLLGSPNPEKLSGAFKVGMALLSPAPLEEREFLGRKIYRLPTPSLAPDPNAAKRILNFTASGGYLALSTDVPMLEEYMRSSETKAKPLSETVGLAAAAEKVGGMGTGLFGYTNQREEMRATLTALKSESASLSDLLKNPAVSAKTPADEKKINDWADFSLLPPYDSISKYFYYSVYGGGFNASGFSVKLFYPPPPDLKK
ncbi:MAG: hypothetical protein ABIQ35_13600 [Verrucomicrobiota bacterium]